VCKLLEVDEAMSVLAIDLSSNALQRVDIDLACMQFLQEADLSFNKISEFVGLGNVPLQSLVLSKNALKDLGGITQYTQLQRLDVGFNEIVSSSGVQQLLGLRELAVHHNLLSDLEGVADLPQLQSLSVEFNKLTQ
jgi:Leucine-rich repeat (LRR) protein